MVPVSVQYASQLRRFSGLYIWDTSWRVWLIFLSYWWLGYTGIPNWSKCKSMLLEVDCCFQPPWRGRGGYCLAFSRRKYDGKWYYYLTFYFVLVGVVQLLGCIQLFVTPWTAARQASLSFTISCSFLKLMSFESVMPAKHLILCRPPFSSCPQSFPPSACFQWVSSLNQMVKVLKLQHQSVNIQGWFPLGLTGLIVLLSEGLSRVFSSTIVQNINSLALSILYGPTLTSIHDQWKN